MPAFEISSVEATQALAQKSLKIIPIFLQNVQ